ncbi:hypothetical protein ACH5RR_032962 [Cinchona calisaya]|uniref:Uncharacterized protein n=1 Tax=Cinchona calisaya TaxID=153742 RepID=A0ABD2YNQ7_9GENT
MIDLNDEFDDDNFSSDSNGDEFVQKLETSKMEWDKFDVLKVEEFMNMTFDSQEEAGEFYNRYNNVGFQDKDLYNAIDAYRMEEVVGGYAEGV